MAETWVVKYSESYDQPVNYFNVSINFSSNNQNFTNIVGDFTRNPTKWSILYDDLQVFEGDEYGGDYIDPEYMTITFETSPTGDLLTWLQSNAVKQSSPQLDAPTNLTVSGTTIEFDSVENAESYEVFADGVSIGEYVPEVSGETWIINEIPNGDFNGDINFTSGGYSCNAIMGFQTPFHYTLQYNTDTETISPYYSNTGWTDQAYRTVTFEEAPTGDLLTWLESNAEKQ